MQGALILLSASAPIDAQTVPGVIETGSFRFSYDERGISGLAHARDPYGTVVVMAPSSFPSLGGLVIPTPADRAELVGADPS